jgi:putative FmdB family regulatory protein
MPTYHYRCPSCGHDFERFEKMNAKSRAKCPACGTRSERMISGGAGLVFKGSGFYITDYKRKGGESGAKAEGSKAEGSKAEPKAKSEGPASRKSAQSPEAE